VKHGFLILDKPVGISSAKAVAEVKRILKCKKIGHGGTLDPLASGVLPLAINEATKTFDYVASSTKCYRFTITFGEERSTDDAEGEVTAETRQLPTRQEILNILPVFIGQVLQVPPSYSAIKIDGDRAGVKVDMEARLVNIHNLLLIADSTGMGPLGRATFEVTCGKGTYVRSLARDIARKINSMGYVSMLRRTAVGKFNEDQAISLEKCAELVHSGALFKAWVPLELALDDIPAIRLDVQQALRIRQGQAISVEKEDGQYLATDSGNALALCRAEQGKLHPMRVFNIN
jgi:tRNA pseudouridine55 synthase